MLDPQLWSPPVVIAHRGSRQLWPENTMIAFQNAISMGARHLETDIHLSADGVVHCFHDHTLQRTTNGHGLFSNLTAAEIAGLDAGFNHQRRGSFQFRGSGVTVPTFEELATSFPEVRLVVDLKEDAVVEAFARLVSRLGIEDRLIVGGFSDHRISRFRDHTDGSVPTSTGPGAARAWFITSRFGRGWRGDAGSLQLPLQRRGLRVVDERLVEAAHKRGLQIHVWTVNDPVQMSDLLDMGVDGLVTDRPDLALSLVIFRSR